MSSDDTGRFRITCDVGGTFTDVVVADRDGRLVLGKALTTGDRMFDGLHAALASAASNFAESMKWSPMMEMLRAMDCSFSLRRHSAIWNID